MLKKCAWSEKTPCYRHKYKIRARLCISVKPSTILYFVCYQKDMTQVNRFIRTRQTSMFACMTSVRIRLEFRIPSELSCFCLFVFSHGCSSLKVCMLLSLDLLTNYLPDYGADDCIQTNGNNKSD